MTDKLFQPTQADLHRFYPLSLFAWTVVRFRDISELSDKLEFISEANLKGKVNSQLADLAILRLNAFFDDGYNKINKIHKFFPNNKRLGPEIKALYSRGQKGKDLHWVKSFRDTFLGHVPPTYKALSLTSTEIQQKQLLGEIPSITNALNECLERYKNSMPKKDAALLAKVHNSENLRAALKWNPNILSTLKADERQSLKRQGVILT